MWVQWVLYCSRFIAQCHSELTDHECDSKGEETVPVSGGFSVKRGEGGTAYVQGVRGLWWFPLTVSWLWRCTVSYIVFHGLSLTPVGKNTTLYVRVTRGHTCSRRQDKIAIAALRCQSPSDYCCKLYNKLKWYSSRHNIQVLDGGQVSRPDCPL